MKELVLKKQTVCGNHEPCYTSMTDSITALKSASVSTNFECRRNAEKNTVILNLAVALSLLAPIITKSARKQMLNLLDNTKCIRNKESSVHLICIIARNEWLKILTPLCHRSYMYFRCIYFDPWLVHSTFYVLRDWPEISLWFWFYVTSSLAGNVWNLSNDSLTCNSPMLERFSNGKGSPWIWLENVNWGSTGKAVGTCKGHDRTRRASTHKQLKYYARQDWFYHYLEKSTTTRILLWPIRMKLLSFCPITRKIKKSKNQWGVVLPALWVDSNH